MDAFTHLLWHNGNFLGIEWNAWKVVGWLGNATFFSRFFVQWYATEKKKQVVVPTAFWWLSLAGSFLL
ncbi:MAG: lipid A biosynthesis acyltransferase, partial [Verrucomicrobia bacterium]